MNTKKCENDFHVHVVCATDTFVASFLDITPNKEKRPIVLFTVEVLRNPDDNTMNGLHVTVSEGSGASKQIFCNFKYLKKPGSKQALQAPRYVSLLNQLKHSAIEEQCPCPISKFFWAFYLAWDTMIETDIGNT